MKKFAKVFVLLAPLVLSSCNMGKPQVTAKSLSVSDKKAFNYHVGEVFDNFVNNGGLKVNVTMSDDSVSLAEKGTFTYQITEKNNPNKTVDGTKPFTTEGDYVVTVSKEQLAPVSENIRVLEKEDPQPETIALSSISASDYTNEVYQNETYTFDGKVIAKYSDGSTKDVTSKATIETISTANLGDKSLPISYTEDNITKTTSAKITVIEKGVDPGVKTLSKIDASGYSTSVYQNETYTFNGIVTATYSDGTTKNVTSSASIGTISTSTTGTKTATISYTENGVTKTTTYSVNVEEKEPSYETITPEQAISICEDLGSAVVSDKEYYVKGIAEDVTYSKQYDNYSGKFKDSNFYFTQTNSNDLVSKTSDVEGKEVIIFGYLELFNGKYQIPYLPKNYSPTGSAYHSIFIKVDDPIVEKVPVASVQFGVSSLNLNTGDTSTVSYTVLPSNATNKTLSWSSSNSTVASVSNSGVITAKTAGNATITAKSTDGSNKEASLTVIVTKVDVPVTGISLNKTSLSIQKGKTAQLTATISPSNASDKTISWSGSANGISVNSSGLVSVSSTATVGNKATIVATANGNTAKTASCVVTVASEPVVQSDAWTLLIYMCGADLESDVSQGGAATEDLTEIYDLRKSLPSDVNVVVQAGGASRWESTYSSVINKNNCNRFHLTTSGYVKDSQTTKVDMSLASSLESFVEWGLTTYPADKVGLVLWNHGGAMDGCCFDEQFNEGYEGLMPSEVASAIPTAIANSNYNKNLEFIGYDCCLMSIQDIAGLNSDYANYMIASEESEWGYGWSYDKWVDNLFAKESTTSILKACVDSFYEDTAEAYADWGDPNDQTLAYYNLQNWDAYETAWEDFASYLKSSVITSSSKWSTFANVINKAQKYGRYTDRDLQSYNKGYICDIFDAKDALNKIKADSNYKSNSTLMNKISAVETAFTGLNVYSKCGSAAGNSYGLCMFCPISGYNEKDLEYASDNTCFSAWRTLCATYGNWYER